MLTKNFKSAISHWLPVLLWAGLIYYLSAQPGLRIATGPADFWTRKPAHIAEYAILSALLYRALRPNITNRKKVAKYAFIIALIYAISDELHQNLVFNRTGKVTDLLFDAAGIIIGIFIYSRYKVAKNKQT